MSNNNNRKKYVIEFDVNKASLNQLKSVIQEIQKMTVSQFKSSSPLGFNSFEEARTELQKIKKLTAEVDKALEDAFNPTLGVPNLTKFSNSIKKIGVDDIARSWNNLGVVGDSATRHLATGLIATNTQLKQSHKLLDDMATSFKNTVKWGISSTVFNTMTNSLGSAWNYAKNLNKVLTDIRIVSDQSATQMERFAKEAAKAAKQLGATTLDYGNAALLYYQQGDSPEQVAEKAQLTVKMANVLGASASEVSNYMTAIWNNFDDGSRSLEYYADVLTKLGAATASSAEEISDGLEKFAAVASTVDLSYEYATAALTTITATTRQSADVVGTALKTLFARIQDLELGETLDDGTTLGKYSEALAKVGISLKGQDGQLRSMDDLLDDMGSKWETLTKNQKIALAQTVAGTRQYTQLVALMDNWDVMQQNITLAQEATGSLQEQQDEYMESTEAHLNKLTASTERFMDALIDDGAINGLIDALTVVTDLLGNFVEGIGGGTNALFMLGSIGTDVFSKQIADSLSVTVKNLRAAHRAAEDTRTAFKNLDAMNVLLEGEDKTAPKLKSKLLSVESEMSEDDIKYVNERIQELSTVTNEFEQANARIDLAVQQYKQFGGQSLDENTREFDLQHTEQFQQIFEKVKVDTAEVQKNMSSLRTSYSELISDHDQESLEKFINQFTEGQQSLVKFGEAYEKVFNEDELREIEEASLKMKLFVEQLENIKNDKNLSDKEKSDAIIYEIDKNTPNIGKYFSSNSRGVETVKGKADNILDTLGSKGEKTYDEVVDASSRARKKILQDLDDVFNKFKDSKEIRSFVKTLSGAGEAVSALLALGNLGDIFNDEDLSGWEKFAQITMTISFAIPTLINGISDVVSGFRTLLDFFSGFGKGFVEALNTTKTISANKMIEESTENVTEEYKELNKTMSVDNTAATNQKIANDQKAIASNEAVVLSIKNRKNAEKADVGEDLVEGVVEATTEKTGEEIGKKVIKESIEEGVEGATKSGIWAGLKAKVGGILGGGASGTTGVATLGAALGKLALVAGGAAAAIGVVAGVVALATHEQRQAEKQAKELAKAVETSKKAFDEATSSYKTFQSEISSLNSAITSINQLTKGTLEWKAAMMEINEQAYALMDTYPELIQYMDSSQGYITFTQEGLDDIKAGLLARTQMKQEELQKAQVNQLEWQLERLEQKAAQDIVNFNKLQLLWEHREIGAGNSAANNAQQELLLKGYQYLDSEEAAKILAEAEAKQESLKDSVLTEEDAKIILNAFKDNESLLYGKDNDEEIIALLKKNNIDLSQYTKESQHSFIEDLRSHVGDIRDYTSSIDEYTEKIAAYTRALLGSSEVPEGATSLEYFIAHEKYINQLANEKTSELRDKYDAKLLAWEVTDDKKQDQLIEEYVRNVLGWTDPSKYNVDKGAWWNSIDHDKEFKVWNGDHEETITYEEAANKLGLYYAKKEVNAGEHDKQINENAIIRTNVTRNWASNYFSNKNKTLNEAFKTGEFGHKGLKWETDIDGNGLPSSNELRWEYSDEVQKEIDKAIKDAEDAQIREAAEIATLISNGISIEEILNTRGYGAKGWAHDKTTNQIYNLSYKPDVIKKSFDTELEERRKQWFIDHGYSYTTADGQVHADENLVVGTTKDKDDLIHLPEQIKETTLSQKGVSFEQWLDDAFQGKDIASLYTAEENEWFGNILDDFKGTLTDGDWNTYYSATMTGENLEDYIKSEINESKNLTDFERERNKQIALEKELQEGIEKSAERLGVSKEAYAAYVDQIREDYPDLKKNNDLTLEIADTHFKFANDLTNLNEAVKDNTDLLKKWGKAAGQIPLNELDPKDMEKIGEVVEAMRQMFGEEVDTDWVQKNVDDIIKLANGDISVYDDLEKDYAKLRISNIEIDPEGKVKLTEEGKEEVRQDLQEDFSKFLDNLDMENLDINAKITMDTQPYLAALADMVSQGILTETQLAEIFGELGFDLSYETRKIPNNFVTKFLESHFNYKLPGTFGYDTVSVPVLTWKGTNKKNYNPSSVTGGAGGSSSKPSKVQKTEDAFDRYHDVNTELKKLSNELEDVQRLTDRSTGGNWVDNLKEQFSLLNKEIETTEEKLEIAEGELKELQGKLGAEGAIFGEDGTLLNYKEIYYKALNELNAAEDHMNSLTSSDAQEKYRDTYEAAQEKYNKIVELISRYDEVFLELIPGLKKDVAEKIDEQTQIKIDAFNAEIEIRLDMADFERDWRDFKRKVINDIKDDDILGNLKADLDQFGIYYNEQEKGTIQRLTDQVKKDMEQLAQFEAEGKMSIYNDFAATQLEDMKAHIESLMSEMENFYELTERIRESYLNMMDEAQEKFDEQIDKYEQVSNLIEHDMNLISMIYGEDAYEDLAQYFNQIHENNLQSLDMLRMEADFWAEEMKKHDKDSEEYKKAEENWNNTISAITSKTEESITNIQNKFTNAVELIFKQLNNKVTNNKGLDYLSKEWELINQNSDRYLDNMNGIYAIQKLQNKYQDAIDSNDSLKSQQQLKTIMDEELKALREKDKLTQYDVDRAELRYQIALKQIALEEAQQNKSQMRLRRDSQGNYTYQYTADEEQISKLESEMSDLYQQLYNLDANEYENNLNELYSVWVSFQEDMKAAEAINDEEAKQARKLMLTEQYGKLINDIVAKDETLKKNLYESTMSGLLDLYSMNENNYYNMTAEQQGILDSFLQDQSDLTGLAYNNLFELYDDCVSEFRAMTDAQKDILVSSMLPIWNSTLAQMTAAFAGEGGFEAVCLDAFRALDNANVEYQNDLKEIETTAGTSFEAIKNGYDKNTEAAKALLAENKALIQSYKDQLTEIGILIGEMDKLILKYEEAMKAAKLYGEEAYKAWLKAKGKDADEIQQEVDELLNPKPEPEPKPEPPKPDPNNDGILNVGDVVTFASGNYYVDSYGHGPSGSAGRGGKVKVTLINGNAYGYHIATTSGGALGWVKKSQLSGFDTGGYTGDWNSTDGRLALLHQKELVLNSQDTKNMLSAIQMVRTMTNNLGLSLLNRLGGITANTGAGLLGEGDALEQIVHIDAQFPNVTNSTEIESALNNLVNRAAQHITKN